MRVFVFVFVHVFVRVRVLVFVLERWLVDHTRPVPRENRQPRWQPSNAVGTLTTRRSVFAAPTRWPARSATAGSSGRVQRSIASSKRTRCRSKPLLAVPDGHTAAVGGER
jgi:hypothetical protein